MIDPVPSGIWGEGRVSYRLSVEFVVEVEEDAEANVCKAGMCRFGENVIVWKTFFGCRESLRCQVLLDGEVRELYDSKASPVDDGVHTYMYRTVPGPRKRFHHLPARVTLLPGPQAADALRSSEKTGWVRWEHAAGRGRWEWRVLREIGRGLEARNDRGTNA
jgi:hypothetical protein